jgi:diaminopropionate ammonia-lyase
MSDRRDAPVDVLINPAADRAAAFGPERRSVLDPAACATAQRTIRNWPGYAPTPLRDLPGLAHACGIARVDYKDEGERFALQSFKALGGAYAVARILAHQVAERYGQEPPPQDLLDGRWRAIAAELTVVCATDGNHGRSVAWGAQLLGCHCVVYLHAQVSPDREAAIAAYGAEVRREGAHYDASVEAAVAAAEANGWFLVPDTAFAEHQAVPRDVMAGYTLMVAEYRDQLAERPTPADQPPTHVLVQAGVGALAAAVCGDFWAHWGGDRPRCILVEPKRADCFYQSLDHGSPRPAAGDLETVMAGLACGRVSPLAWSILEVGAEASLRLDDAAAVQGMQMLAEGIGGDTPIVGGECAGAGVGALVALAGDPRARDRLALGPGSRVVLIGTEGATDPVVYQRLVGRAPEAVRHSRSDPESSS